jgi:hypothetical protein
MKNPDENQDLPLDFKNIYEKNSPTKSIRLFCQTCVLSKKNSRALGKKSVG